MTILRRIPNSARLTDAFNLVTENIFSHDRDGFKEAMMDNTSCEQYYRRSIEFFGALFIHHFQMFLELK